MIWVIAGLFFIISIVLLSGKGAFLIAGYNTSSKADKMKYDEKKLCRVMGCGMGVIAIFMIVLACFGNKPPNSLFIVMPIVIVTVVVVMMVLCNTICKIKNPSFVKESEGETDGEAKKEKSRNALILKATFIFTAVVFVVLGIIFCTGQIKITVNENNIDIDGSYWTDYQVKIDSIKSVSYTENLDTGSRTNGLGNFKLLEGNFRNGEFGDYTLYAYLKCNSYIVLETSNGTVVVNSQTSEETKNLYNVIENAVAQQRQNLIA